MKNIFKSIILAASFTGLGHISFGQCSVTIDPTSASIVCGDTINITANGLSSAPLLQTNFDDGMLGAGWATTVTVLYTNPCGPSLDGSPSAWFGNVPLPRTLTTNGFDVSCGGQVCFDLDFGADDPSSPNDCEDPDLPDEGVHFQYSIDGGTTWVDIFYFQPNSTKSGPYYNWANYCFDIPPAAETSNTMFQWDQPVATSTVYDHWGIDNVVITPSDCGYYYDWDNIGGSPDPQSQTVGPLTSTTVYTVDYTNGIDDTCTASITINVDPFVIDVTATPPALSCGECTDLNAVLSNPPSNGSTYTYSWSPTTDVSDPNIQAPSACPSDDITYTCTVTEDATGCSGSGDVLVTVAGGGAIADFAIYPGNTGCAPFTVDFTNNSVGVSYQWFFDDGSPIDTSTDPSHTFTTMGTYDVMLVAYFPGSGCINYDTAYVTITVGNSIVPVADFGYEGLCGTTIVNFFNTGTLGLTYTWDIDGTAYSGENVTHDFGSTGTYTVTLTVGDAACGTQDQITMDISVVDNPTSYIFNSPSCYQFSDGSITVNTTFTTGNEVFVISNSAGNTVNVGGSNAANNLPGGWYYLDIDLGGGCNFADSVELINPEELTIDLALTNPKCYGDATGIVEIDSVYGAQGDPNNVSFFWNPNPAGIGGIGADSSYNMTAGNYTITINDDNGCSNVYDFTLTEPTELIFTEIGVDPAYCRSFSWQNGQGVVYAAAGGGTPDYDYEWFNLQDSSATNSTTWGGRNPGDYRITVIDGNGCILQAILTVEELDLIADFEMTSAQFTPGTYEGTAPVEVHFVNTSQNFANPNNPNADTLFFWNFNYDYADWVITDDYFQEFDTTYTVGGTYEVCLVVVNANDCSDTACKEIIVYDVLEFEPVNVFTPDGDGINDEFTFLYVSYAVKSFHCVVVDRWGVVMAEFDDISDSWNGKDSKGHDCADGVYFYHYEGEAENGEPFSGQGNVTIVNGKE